MTPEEREAARKAARAAAEAKARERVAKFRAERGMAPLEPRSRGRSDIIALEAAISQAEDVLLPAVVALSSALKHMAQLESGFLGTALAQSRQAVQSAAKLLQERQWRLPELERAERELVARSAELAAVREAAEKARTLAQRVIELRADLNSGRKACVAAEAALKKARIEWEEGEGEGDDAVEKYQRAAEEAAEAVEEARRKHDRALTELKTAASAAARFYPELLRPPASSASSTALSKLSNSPAASRVAAGKSRSLRDFEEERDLSRSSRSRVVLVRSRATGEPWVLKIVHASSGSVQREAARLAELRHPLVVPLEAVFSAKTALSARAKEEQEAVVLQMPYFTDATSAPGPTRCAGRPRRKPASRTAKSPPCSAHSASCCRPSGSSTGAEWCTAT